MLKRLLCALVFFVVMIFSTNQTNAQTCQYLSQYGIFPFSTLSLNGISYVDSPNDQLDYIDNGSVINVVQGEGFSISASGFWMWDWQYEGNLRVFVDFNQDGDFGDLGEVIFSSYYLMEHLGYVYVPLETVPGTYTMRVLASLYDFDPAWETGCDWSYYGQIYDFKLNVKPNKPTIEANYPAEGAILPTGAIYSMYNNPPSPHHPGVSLTKRYTHADVVNVSYKIRGPLPSNNLIYTATEEGVLSDEFVDINDIGEPLDIRFTHAKYAAANQSPDNDGALDLFTNNILGGEYEVISTLKIPSDPDYVVEKKSKFIIALQNDISVVKIVTPKQFVDKKYPIGLIPISVFVKNVGLNPVEKFNVVATIYKNGQSYWQRSLAKDFTGYPIQTGEQVSIEFPNFNATQVGDYTISICCELVGANDEGDYNNCNPLQGETYTFRVAYDQEPQADIIFEPAQNANLYVGRPIKPSARVSNNGITDMSNVNVKMQITDLSGTSLYYEEIATVQDIPAGVTYNSTKITWPNAYIPLGPGDYKACIEIIYQNDNVPQNNIVCNTFKVTEALKGTYTIGKLNANQPRNFATIKDALDLLYLRGIAGSVVFELTDAEYNEGNENLPEVPALDFRSRIVGVDSANTIIFKPSNARSIVRGGVRINLHTGSGLGMVFGQSDAPNNINAPVAIVGPSSKKKYANSDGYIIFDGGAQKAFLLTLKTNSDFRACVYLSSAKNVTIKNCLIQDGLNQNSSWSSVLPNNMFNPSLYQFTFEKDYSVSPKREYSSGIVIRTVPPLNPLTNTNSFNLDTINSTNNLIQSNEISGFGYGVVSLGTGVLMYQSQEFSGFRRYYNKSNRIESNKIYNVARAGIFLGFEERSIVLNNRIYNVSGISGDDAAGIILGGDERNEMWGFSNLECEVSGNEISNINSNNTVYGIKCEVDQLALNDPARGIVRFPDKMESNLISNNIIWGLNSNNESANYFGIRLFTQRNGINIDQAKTGSHFTKNDKIVNNTIVISGKGNTDNNSGYMAGVAIQNADSTVLLNNAIAMLDSRVSASANCIAAVFYQGKMPKENGLRSNRNVYYVDGNSNGDIFRFIYTDTKNGQNIIEYGFRNQFKYLSQWQYWTGSDPQSESQNFMNDMSYIGTNPQNLRIKMNPLPPKSSVLNNRGDRNDYVVKDIDGNVRGVANQRYDIGAVEFNGLMYTSDLELMNFVTPGSYRDYTGEFADAEYIMTAAPVNVKARLRNNGNINQTNINVTVKVYREKASEYNVPNFVGELEMSKTVRATVSSTQDNEIDFLLSNDNGLNDDWNPKTYSDLRGQNYTIPEKFVSMIANVTPRYRIEVSLDNNVDEVLTNNIIKKEVRFYLKRANMNVIISGENTYAKLNDKFNQPLASMNSVDMIAGKLNLDTLLAGFKRIGWEVNVDVEKPRYDLDVFERNGWEPRNVDYTLYQSLIWSDADDKALTRFQNLDILAFLSKPMPGNKRNLFVSSQEMVRLNGTQYPKLINEKLRTSYSDRSGSNLPADMTLNKLVGTTLARNLKTDILTTGWYNGTTADAQPLCTYNDIVTSNEGFARIAYYYDNPTNESSNKKIAGVASSTLTNNVVYMGLDWRHFSDVEFMLRSMIDFVYNSGGSFIPVELLDFRAVKAGNRAELYWSTASEQNSMRFEVEKAELSKAGLGTYHKIDELAAQGNSSVISNYGPVIDRSVVSGGSYSYRLKMIDLNGEYSYSDEKTLTFDNSSEGELGINWEVNPSPISNNAKISMKLLSKQTISLGIYDLSGKLIETIYSGELESGETSLDLNASNLSNGSYIIMLTSGEKSNIKVVQISK